MCLEFLPLLQQHHRDAHGDTGAPKAVFEARHLDQLLVLIALDCHEQVGYARRDEHGYGKVDLLDADDAVNNDGEAEPLGLTYELVVEDRGEDSNKDGLGGLDNLAKAEGAGYHRG